MLVNYLYGLLQLQAVVLPIASEFDNYAKNIFEQCMKAGINTEVDLKNQKINYKIREHSLSKVPLIINLWTKRN